MEFFCTNTLQIHTQHDQVKLHALMYTNFFLGQNKK